MIHPYSYFGFPSPRKYNTYFPPYNTNINQYKSRKNPYFPSNISNSVCKNFNDNNLNKKNDYNDYKEVKNNNEEYDDCFDFLGLKLHFDDLLIICLLFFLYQEDVKDTYLYIVLIILLLS